LPLLFGAGRLRTRLRAFATATAAIFVIGVVVAGGAIADVALGGVGGQWLPAVGTTLDRPLAPVVIPGAALATLCVFRRGSIGRRAVVGAAGFVAGALPFFELVPLVGAPIIGAGYSLLFLAPFAAALVAGLSGLRPGRRANVGLVAVVTCAAVAISYGRADAMLTLPTDALEQRWLLAHRELVADDDVLYVGTVGERRRLFVPFYGECGLGGPRAIQLGTTHPTRDLASFSGAIYYRSSLCSTAEGRPYCAGLEEGVPLVPVAEAELPARPSIEDLGYDRETIRVGLFRRARPSATLSGPERPPVAPPQR
jgi:hypothetical protein